MWVDMFLFFNPELIVPTLTWEHDFLSFSLSTTLYLDACTSHTPKLVSYQLAGQPQHLYFTFNFLCPSTWGLPRIMSMTFVPHGFKRGFYYHRIHFVILHNHEWASDWNPYALVIPNIYDHLITYISWMNNEWQVSIYIIFWSGVIKLHTVRSPPFLTHYMHSWEEGKGWWHSTSETPTIAWKGPDIEI